MNETLTREISKHRRKRCIIIVACVCICLLALLGIGAFEAETYRGSLNQIVRLSSEFLPPDFARAGRWWEPLLDTLMMAIAGTGLAALIALPLACCAAHNTTPHVSIAYCIRFLLHTLRCIPDLIWAVLLCVAFGAGAFAGMLALCLHSIGALGKQFSEHIEHAAPEPIMAIRSSGAGQIAVISHGILAQLQGLYCDLILYRFEINVRTATVLGFVGAGGLGQEILGAMRILAYQEVAAQIILLLVLVAAIDLLSTCIRRRILQRHQEQH